MKHKILLILFVLVIGYMIYNKDNLIIEQLTNGPPSLASLQKDTQELKKELSELSKDIKDMKNQAAQGSAAANVARAQITAVKNSS